MKKIVYDKTEEATSSSTATSTASSSTTSSKSNFGWKLGGAVIAVIALLILWNWFNDDDKPSSQDSEFEKRVEEEVRRRLASQDSTFYMTFTSVWSEPIKLKLNQCLSLQRQDSVAYEVQIVERGWTYLVPERIVPRETTIKLLNERGGLIRTFRADGDGRFTIPVRGTRRVRLVGTPKAIFEVRIRET